MHNLHLDPVGLFLAGWLLCSYLNWGWVVGFFTKEYPWAPMHWPILCFSTICGPIGLLSWVISIHKFGNFRFFPLGREQRFAAFVAEFPGATRESFNELDKRFKLFRPS